MRIPNVLILAIVLAAIGCFARSDSSREGRKRESESPASLVTPLGGGTSGETVKKSITPPSDADGVVVDPNVQFVDGIQVGLPNCAFDGTNYAVAFADRRGTYGDATSVMFMRVSEAGTPIALATTISVPPKSRERSIFSSSGYTTVSLIEVAASPAGTIVGWIESPNDGEQSLLAVRIAPNGSILDSTPIKITSPARQYRSQIYGSLSGVEEPFLVSADSGGFRFAVVEQHPGGGLDINAYRVSLSETSNPVGAPTPLATSLSEIFRAGNAKLTASEQGGIFAWRFEGGPVQVVPVKNTTTTAPTPSSLPAASYYIQSAFMVGAEPNLVSLGSDNGQTTAFLHRYSTAGALISTTQLPSSYGYYRIGFDGTHLVNIDLNLDNGERCAQKYDLGGNKVGACIDIPADPARSPGDRFGGGGFSIGKTTYADLVSVGSTPLFSVVRATDLSLVGHANLRSRGNNQTTVSIASNGADYVAVWRDDRHSAMALEMGGGDAIYAARIAADGSIGSPVRLSEHAVSSRAEPRIIFDGQKYFAVWLEWDPSTYFDPYYREAPANVASAVLSAGGPLTVEKRIRVGMQVASTQPSVASDGVNRNVVFNRAVVSGSADELDLGPVSLVRVGIASGEVVDAEPAVLAQSNLRYRSAPAIASNGSGSIVAWQEIDIFAGLQISLQGVSLPPGSATPSGSKALIEQVKGDLTGLTIAADGEEGFLAAWSEVVSDSGRSEIRGRLFSKTGESRGPTFTIAAPNGDSGDPAVAYAKDGSNYVVAWSNGADLNNYDIHAAWVDRFTGEVKDPTGLPFATLPRIHEIVPALAVAANGKGRMVYQRFDPASSANAFRLRMRTFESGKGLGEACADGDPCGSRYCADGVCCTSRCDDGCGVCNAATLGRCSPKPAGTVCGRVDSFKCDGVSTSCREACTTTADCSPGNVCVANYCEPRQLLCPGEFEGYDPNGTVVSCGDLKCRSGLCLERCGSVDDCRSGLVCDFAGKCVPPKDPVNDADCSFSRAPSARSFGAMALTIAALGCAVWRRRKQGAGGVR